MEELEQLLPLVDNILNTLIGGLWFGVIFYGCYKLLRLMVDGS